VHHMLLVHVSEEVGLRLCQETGPLVVG